MRPKGPGGRSIGKGDSEAGLTDGHFHTGCLWRIKDRYRRAIRPGYGCMAGDQHEQTDQQVCSWKAAAVLTMVRIES